MSAQFDEFRNSYGALVQDSIGFSGLKHDVFMEAKALVLKDVLQERGLEAAEVKAVDVGCGVGTLHPHLAGIFSTLDGCDISAESIARAGADNPWVEYRSHDAGTLPYRDGSFDLAFSSCVVHHVPPADRPRFFAELRRILRPGGVAVIIEHNPLNPLTRLAVFRCPFDDDAVLIGASSTKALFRAAGMTDPRSRFILLSPLRGKKALRFEKAMSGLPLGAQYACSAVA